MKTAACGIVIASGLAFVAVASAQTPSPAQSPVPAEVAPTTGDPKVYGEYPMAYRTIIQRWLEDRLVDPTSAVIDWGEPPKPGEITGPKKERFVGYVAEFKVNARNQFGAPTGKQRYQVVIRNGQVMWGGRPRP